MFGFLFRKNYEGISAANAQQLIAQNPDIVLLDVRSSAEYKSGHLPKAIHIDISSAAFTQRMSQLDKSKKYLVYCLSGGRSARACSLLSEQGLTVTNMEGGISRWRGPVVR
jgi:rhodanese-related sulfurtransferase